MGAWRTIRAIFGLWLVGACVGGCAQAESVADRVGSLVDAAEEALDVRPPEAPEVVRYVGPDGRPAFAQTIDMVPAERRASATRMDLSDVSLNEELGTELAEATEREHARLAATEPCERATDAVSGATPLISRTIDEHGTVLAIAGIVVILLITAPFISRRAPPGTWGRMLLVVLPILAFAGLAVFALGEARRSLHDVRSVASLCDHERFSAAPVDQRLATLRELDRVLEREGVPTQSGRGL